MEGKIVYYSNPKTHLEWATNLASDFDVKCECFDSPNHIGFEFSFMYFYYKKSRLMYREVRTYLEKLPKNYRRWLNKNRNKILKALSV